MSATVYDYTPTQAEAVRAYELLRIACLSRKYHGFKLAGLEKQLAFIEATQTLTSSSAFVSLVLWQTDLGRGVLATLTLTAAIAGVAKAAGKFQEKAERHRSLANSWAELALEFEHVIHTMRRENKWAERQRLSMEWLERRYARLELTDDAKMDRALVEKLQAEVDEERPHDQMWLPSE